MIAMVNMPYSILVSPALATGLLKARLNAAGLNCKAFNLSFLFGELIGMANYHAVSLQKDRDPLIGEWLFARHAWQDKPGLPDDTFFLMMRKSPALAFLNTLHRGEAEQWLMQTRNTRVPEFLDAALERLLEEEALEAVGFSCNSFQTLSSLALIRRLKQERPETKVVCGGSGFHDVMGKELMAKVDLIDAVSLGEADDVIVPLFRALTQGRDPAGLQGVLYRNNQGKVCAGLPYRPVPAHVLEDNPHPDFEEFYADVQRLNLLAEPRNRSKFMNTIETSRGCWKGSKMHCTFCGLNNRDLAFRRMSTPRVIDSLQHLARTSFTKLFQVADRILPEAFFEDLFPRLKENPIADGLAFWVESRSTLSREQVRIMAEANVVFAQAGIETLSTNILKCMRKGATALKNVHYLKLCRTYGIYPLWKILLGIPGEKQEDYDDMAALIPRLVHLTPPASGAKPVEMQRFSPYFNEPGRWADNIRPWPYYKALFPEEKINIPRVAYFFDADWKDVLEGDDPYREITAGTDAWIDVWRFASTLPALTFEDLPGGAMDLVDTRQPGRTATWELGPEKASVYRALDDPVSWNKLVQTVGHDIGGPGELEKLLEQFVDADIAVKEGRRYLGLALPKSAWEPDLAFRSAQVTMERIA